MLNRHERQQLTAIERWFEQSDPSFARSFQDQEPSPSLNRRSSRIALDVGGGVLFTLAVLTAQPMLFLLSIAVITAAVTMHVKASGAGS